MNPKLCYAIPAKILEIDADTAKVDYGGIIKHANISLVDNVSAGDYVLIHAGFAIERLSRKKAVESLELIRNTVEIMDESNDG